MQRDITEFQANALVALVEGYKARAGVKDRLRALNEWEIARRLGHTEASFAEFQEHPGRSSLLQALGALQRLGLVSVWDRGGFYDSFVPTSVGEELAHAWQSDRTSNVEARIRQVPRVEDQSVSPQSIAARLDEIIRLLREIDHKLDRG